MPPAAAGCAGRRGSCPACSTSAGPCPGALQGHVHPNPGWGAGCIDEQALVRPPRLADGHRGLSRAPGLGINLDEVEAARYPWQERPLPRLTAGDGSVIDW